MRKYLFFFSIFLFVLTTLSYADMEKFPLLKAIKLTLIHNNNILIQKESVKASEGDIKISQSKFDTLVNPYISYSHSESPITESYHSQANTVSTGITVKKSFRTGINAGINASSTRTEDISSSGETSNLTTIGFSLNIPLLEGLGVEVADAEELAAKSNLIATKYNMAHTVSRSIYQTSVLYWNYLLAVKNLKEYTESLHRTEKILKQVRILIDKNVRPRADIEQILASLSSKQSTVFRGEQEVVAGKNNLANFIGLDCSEYNKISFPVTDFPKVHEAFLNKLVLKTNEIIEESLKKRYDFLALQQSEKTNKINLIAAINKLKSNLDMNIDVSYKRIEEEKYLGAMIDSFWKERPGFNFSMVLNYQWPVENSYAKGLVIRYQSFLKQTVYNKKQLKKTIFANIKTEISNLEKSYNSLVESIKSVEYYQKAINNEREKYRLGMSTIIDVINIEDKLTSANLNKISAQYNLALAIVKLQYEAGRLIEIDKQKRDNFNFVYNNIVSIKNLLK